MISIRVNINFHNSIQFNGWILECGRCCLAVCVCACVCVHRARLIVTVDGGPELWKRRSYKSNFLFKWMGARLEYMMMITAENYGLLEKSNWKLYCFGECAMAMAVGTVVIVCPNHSLYSRCCCCLSLLDSGFFLVSTEILIRVKQRGKVTRPTHTPVSTRFYVRHPYPHPHACEWPCIWDATQNPRQCPNIIRPGIYGDTQNATRPYSRCMCMV